MCLGGLVGPRNGTLGGLDIIIEFPRTWPETHYERSSSYSFKLSPLKKKMTMIEDFSHPGPDVPCA